MGWQGSGDEGKLAINLSAQDIRNPSMALVQFKLTERSALIEDPDAALGHPGADQEVRRRCVHR